MQNPPNMLHCDCLCPYLDWVHKSLTEILAMFLVSIIFKSILNEAHFLLHWSPPFNIIEWKFHHSHRLDPSYLLLGLLNCLTNLTAFKFVSCNSYFSLLQDVSIQKYKFAFFNPFSNLGFPTDKGHPPPHSSMTCKSFHDQTPTFLLRPT